MPSVPLAQSDIPVRIVVPELSVVKKLLCGEHARVAAVVERVRALFAERLANAEAEDYGVAATERSLGQAERARPDATLAELGVRAGDTLVFGRLEYAREPLNAAAALSAREARSGSLSARTAVGTPLAQLDGATSTPRSDDEGERPSVFDFAVSAKYAQSLWNSEDWHVTQPRADPLTVQIEYVAGGVVKAVHWPLDQRIGDAVVAFCEKVGIDAAKASEHSFVYVPFGLPRSYEVQLRRDDTARDVVRRRATPCAAVALTARRPLSQYNNILLAKIKFL